MPPRTEPQIVEAVMRGDKVALGQLLQLYQSPLYNVCLRMLGNADDAAEITQDAMLKVIEHVKDFHGQSDVSTWMIRIAMNLCISHLRKRKLRMATSLDGTSGGGRDNGSDDQTTPLRQEIADHREPPPDSGVQQRELIRHLHTALGTLDEDFRSVLVLRDIQEMDYQQIAAVLALPVGTVKSRLFRARLALRHEMLKLSPPARASTPAAAAPESQQP